MTDDDLTRIYGMRRTAAKPRPWWRRVWAKTLAFFGGDGDEVFGVRGRDDHRS